MTDKGAPTSPGAEASDAAGQAVDEAPVETQSLLIEAFQEIGKDPVAGRALKTWLLRQKQTHNWPTTTATANACYALLLDGFDWLDADDYASYGGK